MIRFFCECGKQLQAREESAGKAVLCPACNRQLTVPAVPPSPTSVVPEEPSTRPSAEPRVQRGRPAPPEEEELAVEEEMEDRPRPAAGNSGKAVASLVLGILSVFCNVLTGVPALLLGILALRDIGRSRGRLGGHGLAIAGLATAGVCTLLSCVTYGTFLLPVMLLPAVQKVREAAARAQSQNNLKQMGLAMHNYNDTYNRLPPTGVGDFRQPEAMRKPNLSWRVALLPFVEQLNLYNQFKFDEPWDGPNNIKLLGQMPMIYKLPGDDKTPPDHTHYQVFVGNGAAFEKTRGFSIRDFPDGLTNTILIVEAAQAVPWTKPDDIPFDPGKPIAPLLSTYFRSGRNVLLADGSIRVLPASVPENTLKAAITRSGGERFNWP
ncbi:MAG TPA: DUF1559 domain-containing protein [Gemmataceae bacterium]